MNEEGGSGKRIVYCLLENEKRIVKDKRKNFEKMYLFTHERGGNEQTDHNQHFYVAS